MYWFIMSFTVDSRSCEPNSDWLIAAFWIRIYSSAKVGLLKGSNSSICANSL